MDPYRDIIRYYDLEHDPFEDDALFYLNVVQEGPILEVGCGTGRLLEKLARTGLEVWGIDSSYAMLSAARTRTRHISNVHLEQGSIQTLLVHQQFKSVILPLNVLWHIDTLDGQLQTLRSIRSHMDIDGLLVVDVSNPLNMADRESAPHARSRFTTPDGEGFVQSFSSSVDIPDEQIMHMTLWYDHFEVGSAVRRTLTELTLRYTFRYELQLMLEAAGYLVSQVYGSYDLEPYTALSENLIVVAASA